MRRYAPVVSVGVLAVLMSSSLPTRGRSAGDPSPRFVVELFGDTDGGALTLDVTFYDAKPASAKAEDALRHCLAAARVVHPSNDIAAKAWFRTGADASDRQAIALAGGVETLMYVAKDQTVRLGTAVDARSAEAETGAGNDTATIVNDPKVAKACKSVPADQLSVLAGVGIEQRGRERKTILKAMRDWSKENDVASSRALRSCMSSISKAVVALKSVATSLSPEDLAAAITRGKAIFTGDSHCVNCHGPGGRGGRRGPRLNDAEWLHCDGSIEGIRKVISSGVPLEKLKDKSRTSAMQPAWDGPDDAQQLADVTAYVHSLSQN